MFCHTVSTFQCFITRMLLVGTLSLHLLNSQSAQLTFTLNFSNCPFVLNLSLVVLFGSKNFRCYNLAPFLCAYCWYHTIFVEFVPLNWIEISAWYSLTATWMTFGPFNSQIAIMQASAPNRTALQALLWNCTCTRGHRSLS